MDKVRLIDAKAAEGELIRAAGSIKAKNRFDKGESWGLELAAKMVSRFPPIDPETLRPVARNNNQESAACDEFVCSACGIHLESWVKVDIENTDEWEISEYEFKYCPNCGARLED